MNYFLLGHVFLAGTGMYFLARRWFGNRFAATLAGLVFAWNGLSINLLMWPCQYRGAGLDAVGGSVVRKGGGPRRARRSFGRRWPGLAR